MPKDLPPCPYWDAAPVVCEHWHDPPPRAPIDWVRVVAGGVAVVALVLLLLMTCVERKRRNEYAMAVATDGPAQLENGSATGAEEVPDELPKGRVKAIHNHGVVAQIEFVANKNARILDELSGSIKRPSGFLADGSSHCLLRSSI